MKVDVVPYLVSDGIPSFTDSFIGGLYNRMQEDGMADTVFYDGRINSGKDFVRFIKATVNHLSVVYADGKLAGVLWLNGFECRFARFHWCIFSNMWRKDIVALGKEVITIILNRKDAAGEYLLDGVVGITPSWNERAIEYLTMCGGVTCGEAPFITMKDGRSTTGVFFYYARETEE